ncbi:hypothetical protein BP6252_10974 [Coleophoma cylindrospora]|uniref:Heterokaryon incompatibility domain-containing protein n=1 Tax=Coleophoma cylindrospora TaxID=1849047 RepID=A0A3D8QNR5_9HELO|nr:hypothetical protein BP6252_10974 [Coleophoma cylindrospora]
MSSQLFSTAGALEYSPLPAKGGFLRLLDVLPSDHGSVLQCSLREASLSSQKSYKAVSYAWVDDTADVAGLQKTIVCNGIQISIQENLYSALRTFQNDRSIVTLWVDYLCINQQDDNERSEQVKIMREIYSHSSEVLIWLGPNKAGDYVGGGHVVGATQTENEDHKCVWHNDNSDHGMMDSYFESFRLLEREPDDEFVPPEKFTIIGRKATSLPWLRDVFGAFCVLNQLAQGVPAKDLGVLRASMTSPGQIAWSRGITNGFWAIVDSSWWQRTWVIQESVVARKATVYFGHMSAPWTMLSEAAATYVKELAASDLISGIYTRDPISRLANDILDIESVRIARVNGLRPPFLSILRRFRTKKSSDPRDKVFGLLGLADEEAFASLAPDYSLSREKVMLRTAVEVIFKSSGLEALAGSVTGPSSVPSWMTDWAEPPMGSELERLSRLHLYNASRSQAGITRLHGDSLLELQGYFVDTINFVGVELPADGIVRMKETLAEWKTNWFAETRSSQYRDKHDAFWRTISADTSYVESTQRSTMRFGHCRYRRAGEDGCDAFDAWTADDTAIRNRRSSMGPGGLMKNYVEPAMLSSLKNSFYYAFLTASTSRKFFSTKNGFIGIGPPNLVNGDKVFIVLGSRVPLILRPTSVSYQRPIQDSFKPFGIPLAR